MRGYSRAKKNNSLQSITKIQAKFTTLNLGLKNEDFSNLIMGGGHINSEIIIRQYLLLRVGYTSLRSALLFSVGCNNRRVSYPLPKARRKILESEGFLVNNFNSSILWAGYILIMFFYGCYKILYLIIKGIFLSKKNHDLHTDYCYFLDLNASNFRRDNSSGLFFWYLNWAGRAGKISSIKHSVKNHNSFSYQNITTAYQSAPIPDLPDLPTTLRFMLWGFKAITIALIDMLRGRWWHAFILNQAAMSGLVRCIPKQIIARQYMFPNSHWLYRPLWTYDAELKGSDIVLYFYSTNCEASQTSENYTPYLGYESMTWPKYLVWDVYQESFIKRTAEHKGTVEIVGPVDFSGDVCALPIFKLPPIAVFDVTPHRGSRYCVLRDDDGLHTPIFVNKFLDQISKALTKNSFCMLWKRKREIGRLAHPSYRSMQEIICSRDDVIEIPTNVAANYLIENSVAVISSPYTSTAVIAKAMGKPSVYYDPLHMLRKGDPAAHGIQLLQGEDELMLWLSSLRSELASNNPN